MSVIRYQIADYLDVGTAEAEQYVLMGVGFLTLDENPSAKIDTTAFINNKSASGTITGYENTFPFDTQLIAEEKAIKKIYDIARNQRTGNDAVLNYVRIEMFEGATGNAYPARKFKVAVEVSGITGNGTEIVRVAGNLHQVGDFIDGTFNTSTKTFTATTDNVGS